MPLDQSLLEHLRVLIGDATRAFEGYDYARALELTERFFWGFCDDYLELVKQRAYGAMGHEPARSAQATLAFTLDALLRLFAPHLPFVTEEVWSWWRTGSVHQAAWPSVGELPAIATPGRVFELAADTLGAIRKEKSTAQRSMRTEVTRLVVRAPADELAALDAAVDDLREAGCIVGAVELVAGDDFAVEVDLVEPEPAPQRD
jgi:valyl-tRNA synthetase